VCCVLFERGVLFCEIYVFLCVLSYCSTNATGCNPFAVHLNNNNSGIDYESPSTTTKNCVRCICTATARFLCGEIRLTHHIAVAEMLPMQDGVAAIIINASDILTRCLLTYLLRRLRTPWNRVQRKKVV
jgi:hypothetical protein